MQEDNYKKLENNFNKQYETKYSKILEEREQKRLKNLKSKAVCFYVSAIIVIVEIILTAMILILGQNGTIPQAITGIVIQLNILISLASVIFSLVFSYQTDCKKTNKELKTTLLPSILAQLNVRYKLAADFNKNLLERTLVTNKHKLSKFDNSIR